jgi:protein TonB
LPIKDYAFFTRDVEKVRNLLWNPVRVASYGYKNLNHLSMETKVLVFRNWNDLVFFNRNQDYGAYPIRQAYSRRLILAFGVSTALIAIVLLMPRIMSFLGGEKIFVAPKEPPMGTIHLIQPPSVVPKVIIPKHIQTQVRTNTPSRQILVVRDQVVEDVPFVDTPVDGGDADVGGEAVEGTPDGVGILPVETPVVAVTQPWVLIAEVMPVYTGGTEAMMKFIRKNIKYPATARRLGIDGTVFVSFVVHGDGSISHVSVLRGIHPHCDAEAMRVIGMLPGWIGGKQGGNPVAVKMVLPIKFSLEN